MYPPTPLYALKKTNTQKMQSLINKTLRWVNGDHFPYETTVEELHNKYNLSPLNVKLFEQNEKLWEKIHQLYPQRYDDLKNNRERSHAWWPTSIITEETQPPAPIYVTPTGGHFNRREEIENYDEFE